MIIWDKITSLLNSAEVPDYFGSDSLKVNCHIHTPYSFSSFNSIEDIVKQAVEEGIFVIGINDFNTIKGYSEWAEMCLNSKLFPLFNIEMIGLNQDDKLSGRKVNDPNNPGRTYISGKALSYPVSMSAKSRESLNNIQALSNRHVSLMTDRVNIIFKDSGYDLLIDFERMLREMTKGMVRERHLAGMIRKVVEERYEDIASRQKVFVDLLGDAVMNIDLNDSAALENIIRSLMLKAGGSAFIEEDPEIFISPEAIRDIILDAGGIPTYPFLADFGTGNYTDFEEDHDLAAESLMDRGFFSAEFIPGRNDKDLLKKYVTDLYNKGFIVSFGTEHNAPGIAALEVSAKGEQALDDDLLRINYESACIMAAHQYMNWKEGEGYLDDEGRPVIERKDEFVELGNRLIRSLISLSS